MKQDHDSEPGANDTQRRRLLDRRQPWSWVDAGTALLLFLLNLLIVGPFLRLDFSSEPWNNDYIHIGYARIFRDATSAWNPLAFGGAPLHYQYPPMLMWLMVAMPVHSLGRAYHLVAGIGYALVPVALFILTRQLFGIRWLAAFAAIAYSLLPSPAYVFGMWRGIAQRYHLAPWGFITQVVYCETAHTWAVSFTLLTLAAAWRNHWKTASLCMAAVLLLNWAGVVGLGLALLALAVARARDLGVWGSLKQVTAAAGVAYGISAFWMNPGFFYTTHLLNRIELRSESPSAPWSPRTLGVIAMAGAILFGLVLWPRINGAVALVLALLAATGTVVLSSSWLGYRLLPLPNRYMLEFSAAIALGLGALIFAAGALFGLKRRVIAAALAGAIGLCISAPFLRNAWSIGPHSMDPDTAAVFPAADWLRRHAGNGRALVAGELESTLGLWTDIPQIAGGGRQGTSNYLVMAAHREITVGCGDASGRIAELWMRALNIGHVVVHGPESKEYFHWFVQPERFTRLAKVWDNHEGDAIYELPGLEPAVVVDLKELDRLGPLTSTADTAFLDRYVAWARGKRPARIHWDTSGRAEIEAEVGADEAVLVKEDYDPGWYASTGKIAPDPIGFLLIRGTQGVERFTARFGASWDVWLGRAITAITLLLLLVRVPLWVVGASAAVPAAIAYLFLSWNVPANVRVAEETFFRINPPLINPGGIINGNHEPPPLVLGGIASIYGLFGSSKSTPRVWIDGQEAKMVYHEPTRADVMIPEDAAPMSVVSAEVNGCPGNAYSVATKSARQD
ncbi:MAG: hypothetical protein ABSF12_00680 [Bryobacteraceae bacterium]